MIKRRKLAKKVVIASLSVLVIFTLAACNNGEREARGLEIQGSDTMVNLNQTWAEDYMGTENDEHVSVTGGGSGTGIAALINDNVDIAAASREMKTEEIAKAQENNVEVHEFIVGQDGLAVGVHEQNPIDELTTSELKAIFTGEVREWSELGYEEGGEISVYSRQSNSGTYVYFNENIMNGEDWADNTKFMSGSSAINEALKEDEQGIGYYGVGYVDDVKALNVAVDEDSEYYSPLEEENVNQGLYPIARPLYYYTNGVPQGSTLNFLNYVLEDGQDLINKAGYYALTLEYEEQNQSKYEELDIDSRD